MNIYRDSFVNYETGWQLLWADGVKTQQQIKNICGYLCLIIHQRDRWRIQHTCVGSVDVWIAETAWISATFCCWWWKMEHRSLLLPCFTSQIPSLLSWYAGAALFTLTKAPKALLLFLHSVSHLDCNLQLEFAFSQREGNCSLEILRCKCLVGAQSLSLLWMARLSQCLPL